MRRIAVSTRPKKQSGVALVLAMMIVALVAVVATEISWRFELSISRSGNRWFGMQARSYLDGMEQYAMKVLREDAEDPENKKSDHPLEDWAQEVPPIAVGQAMLAGRIEDAEGRLNVNMLMPKTDECTPIGQVLDGTSNRCRMPNSVCEPFTGPQLVFMRMLQMFDIGDGEQPEFLPQDQAQAITEAVMDWLDSDSNIRGFGGAESDYYESLEPPVAIANQLMVSVSELQVIKGMPPRLYEQLLRFVVALPDEVTHINLATASPEVLRAIKPAEPCELEPYAEELGSSLHEFVSNGEFRDWAQMADSADLPAEWSNPSGTGSSLGQDIANIKQSKYFFVTSEVAIDAERVRRGASLLKREEGGNANQPLTVKVVRRSDANF